MSDEEERCWRIRKTILEMSFHGQSAHVGSSLSCVEILASLFKIKADSFPDSKILLSKGHAAMALYATAIEFGLLDESAVENYLKNGSSLWGHPSLSDQHSFIHWSTGSLGHGFPAIAGMAYAGQKLLRKAQNFFCVLSDGELNEGSNWEAALFCAHHQLNKVCVIVDYNKIQSFGRCEDVMGLEPLTDKWRAFGWNVAEVDGHFQKQIQKAIQTVAAGPRVIIAHTVKGKGLSPFEDKLESHYKPVTSDLLKMFTTSKSY